MAEQESNNQSPSFADVDLYETDRALKDAVAANGAVDEARLLGAFGRRWGAAEMAEHARLANENVPRLQAFDARGDRRDTVEFHPSYHHLLKESIGASLHCSTWTPDGARADAPAEVARAARFYMVAQVENGHLAPMITTRAAVAPLGAGPPLAAEIIRKVVNRHYDPGFRPWEEKFGLTLGMGVTERQGGTDVRGVATRAAPLPDGYAVTGRKWFMSAPMSDAFVVLAQAPGGPSAVLVPRFRPDGSINAIEFQRLKNTLGGRSGATAEVEFRDAFGWLLGEEGAGVRTVMDMVQLTRADCAVSSAGLMRAALSHAVHHARHRGVFGRRLWEQPLMRAVLADLALESEAAVALVFRLARSFDLAGADPAEHMRARLLTPAAKYRVGKAAPGLLAEAMECLGGNGYVEDGPLPRLYREAPVNAIWEGAGNVVCLDVLRILGRRRDAVWAVIGDLAREASDLPGAAATVAAVKSAFDDPSPEGLARIAVEKLALLAAAAALRACGSPVAETFARVRLVGGTGLTAGTSGLSAAEMDRLLGRAMPG
ncbi:acyl-CoA dehydrogenase family protein [Rhodoplanes sp. TEM]|uniref:Acyl-CoA dehydrogenase family protein n=1 Tax=Rhodoplanes tepidamans TaxID=200616 RepID=A0ABT5J6K0_RHOTP|nr:MULTISPECIES: acyl-CoA dehydrogenase family protein [Rhodoplanes]MDC7785280.1 acyl-CoA dehydrogenase family protein [Rhodoplanes tepidamans]MDC7984653.1 acyl-CoA dehydrogenase family protein [Rhodoplanes sp. TEM]MDQ0353538.1 putative acyl-CoA dehydrogenase [Rhodoplanes tepidamans]